MECVTCVCVWRGAGWGGRCCECEDLVWALPILEEHGKVGYVSVFWLRWCWGEWVSGQGLGGWGGVKSVFVVSLDYLC